MATGDIEGRLGPCCTRAGEDLALLAVFGGRCRSHAKRRERAEKYIFGVMTILYLKKSVISAFVIQKAPVLQTPG